MNISDREEKDEVEREWYRSGRAVTTDLSSSGLDVFI